MAIIIYYLSISVNKLLRKRYGAVLGSAVNPVLREGNSDRRCAPPVKEQVIFRRLKEWGRGGGLIELISSGVSLWLEPMARITKI